MDYHDKAISCDKLQVHFVAISIRIACIAHAKHIRAPCVDDHNYENDMQNYKLWDNKIYNRCIENLNKINEAAYKTDSLLNLLTFFEKDIFSSFLIDFTYVRNNQIFFILHITSAKSGKLVSACWQGHHIASGL